ncbi:MAG: beta-L-arabinofuranosidase domain-containing protein [Phycisphaerae bacterium]
MRYNILSSNALSKRPFLAAAGLTVVAASALVQAAPVITPSLPTGENRFYVGNRQPLTPSPFIKLPVGSIRPEGWVRTQLELMAEGMTGRLTEISPWCKFEGSAWTDPQGRGRLGWEELPYWLRGFISLGYALNDSRILDESKRWIEATLASARPSGYFGPQQGLDSRDLWPNMCMLYALRTDHEATGDERVLKLMTNYFKWQSTLPFEHLLPESWQKIRGGDNLDSIYWLYNRTGESWLLEVARVNHERTADWTGGVASWHGVNIAECFREPAQFYQQYADPRYLKAAYRNYDTIWGLYGQVPGGGIGADEICRPGFTGPRQGTETCTWVEFMHSAQILLKISGDGLWADRCEEVALNSLPASCTPDHKGLHYLTAPNQIQLDRKNKAPLIYNAGDMFTYTPFEQYRCCQHNVAFGWPYYAEHLWMATPANGLAAVFYAAGTVKAKVGDGTKITVKETTDYPFDEVVEFKLSVPRSVKFPLVLRIPGWCEGARVNINGQAVQTEFRPGTWATLEREWADGDTVRLELPMTIQVKTWAKNHNAVSVHRGPITYSLKIGEKWVKYGKDPWPGYEVFPTTPWNYGLVLDAQAPAKSFEVIKTAARPAAQPFTHEGAPIALKAKGRRIPEWKQEPNGLVCEIQGSPVRSEQPIEDITLIPMGCARLRISQFPTIGEGPEAKTWSSQPYLPTASFHNRYDSLSALNDRIEPKSSGDQSIPRFTWWDHRGTREWVQYTFPEPRKFSWVEVYWFDDIARGGGCRLPASWKVQWLDGDTWKDVRLTSGSYPRKADQFNRATFEPVTTTAIRLDVQLAPGLSAGILEWKYGE